jgi:hypothetical protein
MRYDDKVNSWIIDLEEWINSGLEMYQYEYLKKKKKLKTNGHPAPGKPVEIILSSIKDEAKREQIMRALHIADASYREAMDTAHTHGANMSDVAVANTARNIQLNAAYILAELRAEIDTKSLQYVGYYAQYTISMQDGLGYGQLCAVAAWLYDRVQRLRTASRTQREYNRLMRSLRANFLEVLPKLQLIKKIPENDVRFAQWIDDMVRRMNDGAPVHEVVEVKRQGNKNASRLTEAQIAVAERIYCNGNYTDRQVYDRVREHGRLHGWWRRDGQYQPVSYGTISGYLRENRDRLELKRSSYAGFYHHVVPTIDRSYPVMKNYCWGIDGTAHNENVYDPRSGGVMQYIYVVKVFDYATFSLLHQELHQGVSESGEMMIAALKGAILAAGHKPYIVQMDDGPGNKELRRWCEDNQIHVLPSQKGIARSKFVEALIGMMDNVYLRHLKGWNGMNRTATSRNSRPGDRFLDKGKRSSRSIAQASEWLRTECIADWNSHIIETYEDKPLGKSPDQLWNEKESKTPHLDYATLLWVAGTMHTVKKTRNGIDIQHDNYKYRFLPDINDTDKAVEIWEAIPTGTTVQVYAGEYGQPVSVWQGDRYHGVWTLKERVPMFATFEGDTETFNKMRAFQNGVIDEAQRRNAEMENLYNQQPNTDNVEKLIKEPLVGRKVTGRLDKAALNAEEMVEKAGLRGDDAMAEFKRLVKEAEKAKKEIKYREVAHPDTGEILYFPIND